MQKLGDRFYIKIGWTDEEISAVDGHRWSHRIDGRSETIRQLVALGLAAAGKNNMQAKT